MRFKIYREFRKGTERKVKAWLIRGNDIESCEVVFAETRGKAKSIALQTDTFCDCDFCDLKVYRKPVIDKYYKDGKTLMDWDNQKDRLALVKACGFSCIDDCFGEFCEDCLSKEYCDRYDEYIEWCQDYD